MVTAALDQEFRPRAGHTGCGSWTLTLAASRAGRLPQRAGVFSFRQKSGVSSLAHRREAQPCGRHRPVLPKAQAGREGKNKTLEKATVFPSCTH